MHNRNNYPIGAVLSVFELFFVCTLLRLAYDFGSSVEFKIAFTTSNIRGVRNRLHSCISNTA